MTNKIVSIASIVSIVSIASIASITPIEVAAQNEGQYRLADATQLWRLTDNAAGLGIDNSDNRGYAEFDFQHSEGDYRRVQEGGQRNQLKFDTERYQRIGQMLVGYGRFTFGMDRTKDRSWCDVMRPYNSNPFFSGSSISGKYDTQQFDFSAALSTIPIPLAGDEADRELALGCRLDYKASDLSRLRDPRSRSELLDYKIAPAVTYTFGRNTLGLAGYYDRRKEKIPNITTVQNDPNLMYYQMTGMEQATGLVGGYSGFQREWVNHQLGAELTFSLTPAPSRKGGVGGGASLNSIGIARGKEDVWGQYKYSPGQYTSYIYKVSSYNRLRSKSGSVLHQLDLEADFQQAYADEYRQTLVQERDADKGYTSYRYDTQITYKKRYQVQTYDACLHYRYNGVNGDAIYGYLGAAASLQGAANKHLLPTSKLEYQRMNFSVEAGHALLNDRLWFDAIITYSHAPKADLSLAEATTDYAVQVLEPDMAYYSANFRRGQLSLKYLFPFTFKGIHSNAYIKAYADILKAQHSLDRKTFGATLGLYY